MIKKILKWFIGLWVRKKEDYVVEAKERGKILTSDGKEPRFNKQGKISNQRGAFGRA